MRSRFGYRWLASAAVAALLVSTGCTTIVTFEPEPPESSTGARLRGLVEYDGNPTFLPTMLPEMGAKTGNSDLRFQYQTWISYKYSSIAQIFNPLTLFGYRGVGLNVTATPKLDVMRDGRKIATHDARCVVKLRRSAWAWCYPSESELRKRALIAVRDTIDQELTTSPVSGSRI